MSTEALLLTAIGSLSAVVVYLFMEGRSSAKAYAKDTAERDKKLLEATDKLGDAIKSVVQVHQRQEDEMHERNEKALRELADSHRREMSNMVDRVLEASRNDKEHDREERRRILAVAEALERRIPSRGGSRGG